VVLKALFLLVAVATAACVPETEELEAEVYEICYRGLEAQVARVSADSARGVVTVEDIDFGRATLDEPRIGLRTLRVEPTGGVADFRFVNAAYVDVSNERVLDLASGGVSLYGEESSPLDLLGHVTDDTLALTLTVEGQIPADAWSVSIDACFDVDGITVTR